MILAQGTLAYSLTSVMGAIPAEMDAMCCGEPVRHPTQKSRVGLTPGNPHAFPRIRIWRGRRVLAVQRRLAQQIIGKIYNKAFSCQPMSGTPLLRGPFVYRRHFLLAGGSAAFSVVWCRSSASSMTGSLAGSRNPRRLSCGFSLYELRFSVPKRTGATIPRDRLSAISLDPA